MSRLQRSSRFHPCPVCHRTKDGDCRMADHGLVLCHTFVKGTDQVINGYQWKGCTNDGLWGKWVPLKTQSETQWEKPQRPTLKREWDYCDRNGVPLIRVHRLDKPSGKQIWQEPLVDGLASELQHKVMPYRYQDCLNAQKTGQYVFWVEGEHTCDALWSIGLAATTTIRGSGGYRSEQYRGLFDPLLLVLCPDRDEAGIKYAEAIAADYPASRWLYAKPESPLWHRIQGGGGYDIADWIDELKAQGNTIEDIRQRILGAIINPEQRLSNESLHLKQDNASDGECRLTKEYSKVKEIFGNQLRYNMLTKEVELEGKRFELSDAKFNLALDFGVTLKSSEENVARICSRIAQENSYSPVQQYLETVYRHSSLPSNPKQSLLSRIRAYLGCSEPIHALLVVKTLIGAVARAYNPGSKQDTTLILSGAQGLGKSAFWRALASPDWFDDSLDLDTLGDKDSRLQLHSSWIIEFQEAEQLFSTRKQRGTLKAFLTTRSDRLRRPYGRSFETLERHFIIVGTTNHQQFLDDPTGNRRIWIVPVTKRIPIGRVEAERDQLWAEAVALYKAGEPWWLTDEEQYQVAEQTKVYENEDPWLEPIQQYLMGRNTVKLKDILLEFMKLDIAQCDRQKQNRVAAILTQLGWEKRHTRSGKVWVKKTCDTLATESGVSDHFSSKCENYGSHGSHGSQSTRNPDEMGTFDRDPSRAPSCDPQKDGSQMRDPRAPSCDPQKDGSQLWLTPEILKNQGVEGSRDPRDPCDPQNSQIKRYGYVNGSEYDVYYDGLG